MRSVNAAATAGSKIGRTYPDAQVSDDVLRRVTNSEILPQIALFKSKRQRHAEELRGFIALLVMLIVVGLAAIASIDLPNPLFPLTPELHLLPFEIGAGVVILTVGAMLAVVAYQRAAFSAKAEHAATVQAILDAAYQGALTALNARRIREGVPLPRNIQRSTGRPDPVPGGVTPLGAEHLVAQWMRHLGEPNAEVTQYQGDGGVDVVGERYVAQVKHFAGSVGVAPIREIAGVAHIDRRGALFFTATGYSLGAIEFANRAEVALFVYSAERAELFGINDRAKRLMNRGLGSKWS